MMKKPAPAKKLNVQQRRKKKSLLKKMGKRPAIYDPTLVLFTAIQRLLPQFGIPLDIPDVCAGGLVVRSKKSERYPYAFIMEAINGMLTYGIHFTKSYPPDPHYAVETAVAFATEGRFCFSITLNAGECAAIEPTEVAGWIVQKFTACIMACVRASELIAEIESDIDAWTKATKQMDPLMT